MKFAEFSLNEKLQKGIENAGYVECTPVQEKVFAASERRSDLYVQSQTGTGKTAAYLISIINQLLNEEGSGKQALIMVPTRELAVQVQEEAEKLCSASELKCESFYGGVGYDRQVAALKRGVDILIGTPGRVIDLHEGNQMDLSKVAFLVVDEADRMFDMGFYPDLRTLIKVLPACKKRQTYLFSATLNSYVKNLAWEYTREAEEITIEADNITVDEIEQKLLHVSSADKMSLLLGIIKNRQPESLIIFANTKKTCEIVSKRLKLNDYESEYIIGDLPQKKRLSIMERFKTGQIKCLVATDVAARGIDVNDLAMVINYDLPNEAENYVHRIGRTARAGKSGIAYTFCSEQDVYSLPAIERYIEKQIPAEVAVSEMFAEDKSRDVYIKLDSYREERNDKSEFGKKRAEEYSKRNGGKGNRGRGRYSSKNEKAKAEYKRDRRVYNKSEEIDLSNLSSEERMKFYKEKYAGSANRRQFEKSSGERLSNGSKQNGYKNRKRPNGKKSACSNKVQNLPKTNKRKSIWGKIKSLFGGKK